MTLYCPVTAIHLAVDAGVVESAEPVRRRHDLEAAVAAVGGVDGHRTRDQLGVQPVRVRVPVPVVLVPGPGVRDVAAFAAQSWSPTSVRTYVSRIARFNQWCLRGNASLGQVFHSLGVCLMQNR